MNNPTVDEMIDLLDVRLNTFSVYHVPPCSALQCDTSHDVVVLLIFSGRGVVEYHQGSYPLRSGTIVVVPQGVIKVSNGPAEKVLTADEVCQSDAEIAVFDAKEQAAELVLGCATIEATLAGVLDIFEHLSKPISADAVKDASNPLLIILQQELLSPKIGTRALSNDIMKHVLITSFRDHLGSNEGQPWLLPTMSDRRLSKAAIAMMSHPGDPHSIDRLADAAGMSRSRFVELFKHSFGRSPTEFLSSARLKAAQRILLSSSLPVKSVAAAVGYQSRSHFCRAFRAAYGTAPSAFRTQARGSSLSRERGSKLPEWERPAVPVMSPHPIPQAPKVQTTHSRPESPV